jgi:hypothetical protein
MQKLQVLVVLLAWLAACRQREAAPDVSHLRAETGVVRFEKEFFAIDTNRIVDELERLHRRHPHFVADYLSKVLGIGTIQTPQAAEAIRMFISTYRPVYNAATALFDRELPRMEKDMQQALRYLMHYLPDFKPEQPFELITFIGPMDAYEPFQLGDYGDVRTASGVGVALQLHLGANHPLYDEGMQAGIFYDYQVRRFTPETVVVNGVKNIIQDLFPYSPQNLNLVEQMIEKGKRMALLQRVLPEIPDSLHFGYTSAQWKGCVTNEALIWNFFVKNDLLYSKDPSINRNYNSDGPKTEELGQGAPGYIGLFVGRQLVNAYLERFPQTTMDALMRLPAMELFEKAGYKP